MIEIVPYQSRWREEFRELGTLLRAALGELALRVDHIGSTAVPGLAAKDIIDVQITVSGFDLLDDLRSRLAAAGLVFQDFGKYDTPRAEWSNDDQEWEKAYFREGAGMKRTHVHVRVAGRANQQYALLFRDYLRVHPKIAAHYAAMKYKMAEYFGAHSDRLRYVEGKDPMVDLIATLAKEWGENSEWMPGQSDA